MKREYRVASELKRVVLFCFEMEEKRKDSLVLHRILEKFI